VPQVPPRLPLGEAIAYYAATDPSAPALLGAGRCVTYGELAARAAERTPRPGVVVVEDADPFERVVEVVVTASVSAAALLGGHPDDVEAGLRQRLAPFAPGDEVRLPRLDDMAMVFATSGSTGQPKLVPNTHLNIWASAVVAVDTMDLGRGDRCLSLGSMNHVLGLRPITDALLTGGAAIIPAGLRVDVVATVVREHHPTWTQGSPPGVDALAAAFESLSADDRDAAIAELRLVKSASATLRPSVVARLRRTVSVPILRGYALTEVGKIASTRLGGDEPEASVGPPVGAELRLDPVEDIAEEGVGEIVVRGDTVAPGYLDDAHRSATAFEAGGWFRTGDIGRLDERGNLFLVGRRDDLVSRGGEMVSLGLVEATLEDHPAVAGALAAAVPHPSMGMDVVLGYVVEPGVDDPGVGALRSFLDERLSTGQVPVRLLRLDEIPLTPSHKPSRQALADRFQSVVPVRGRNQGAEVELATLWSEVLGIEVPMDPWDDFFALGGSSLALVELTERIAGTFGVEVAPGELVGHPTLREMAAVLRPRDRRPRQGAWCRSGPASRDASACISSLGGAAPSPLSSASSSTSPPGARPLGSRRRGSTRASGRPAVSGLRPGATSTSWWATPAPTGSPSSGARSARWWSRRWPASSRTAGARPRSWS
jgi:acyl-CoA synthetase (AMP-forming)/AMP-acid ligase II